MSLNYYKTETEKVAAISQTLGAAMYAATAAEAPKFNSVPEPEVDVLISEKGSDRSNFIWPEVLGNVIFCNIGSYLNPPA